MMSHKILKYVFKLCEFILLFILVVGITAAITKNIYSEILISNFKSKGIFQEELSTDKIKIYHIESVEERPTYTIYNNKITPGNTGDIVISLDLILENEMVGGIVSFFAGGHAGLILDVSNCKSTFFVCHISTLTVTPFLSQLWR